jgi:hypothetical protein
MQAIMDHYKWFQNIFIAIPNLLMMPNSYGFFVCIVVPLMEVLFIVDYE